MKTILLVDDSPSIRLTLKTLLSLSDFQVETAEDGEEALGRLQRGLRPDLIITDLHIPRMDGLTFTRAARPLLASTPILLLTVESRHDQRELARQAGATGWLLKPVKPATLLKAIQRVAPGP
jgi:two-component system chemotaxis response regulator CheY